MCVMPKYSENLNPYFYNHNSLKEGKNIFNLKKEELFMPWIKGKIEFDDGTIYPAEILLREDGKVWNTKIYKDGKIIKEFEPENFADKLGKRVDEVYPYKYHLK